MVAKSVLWLAENIGWKPLEIQICLLLFKNDIKRVGSGNFIFFLQQINNNNNSMGDYFLGKCDYFANLWLIVNIYRNLFVEEKAGGWYLLVLGRKIIHLSIIINYGLVFIIIAPFFSYVELNSLTW